MGLRYTDCMSIAVGIRPEGVLWRGVLIFNDSEKTREYMSELVYPNEARALEETKMALGNIVTSTLGEIKYFGFMVDTSPHLDLEFLAHEVGC